MAGQQNDALTYFRTHAKEWAEKATTVSPSTVNMINQRSRYVLSVIGGRQTTELALDVGCGTGELVFDIARRGAAAIGVDFAPEMIQIAKERARNEDVTLAQFFCISIFEFDMTPKTYDCISANGFIEYVSFDQLIQFVEASFQGLKADGSLVLGSRNRLFNVFSLNDFTTQEIEEGAIEALLEESIAFVNGAGLAHLLTLDPAPLPQSKLAQARTGIDVPVRRQYTPVQLMKILHDKGFQITDIAPIHIHGMVPRFKDLYPEAHADISNFLHTYAVDHPELIPQSSSFMIHARKRA